MSYFKAKITQIDLFSTQTPAYSASPDPLAAFKDSYL